MTQPATANLKKNQERRLVGVTFHQNMTVFGKNTSQLGATMVDISIRWDETNKRVVVTSALGEGDKGEEWIHEAAIAKTVWR